MLLYRKWTLGLEQHEGEQIILKKIKLQSSVEMALTPGLTATWWL